MEEQGDGERRQMQETRVEHQAECRNSPILHGHTLPSWSVKGQRDWLQRLLFAVWIKQPHRQPERWPGNKNLRKQRKKWKREENSWGREKGRVWRRSIWTESCRAVATLNTEQNTTLLTLENCHQHLTWTDGRGSKKGLRKNRGRYTFNNALSSSCEQEAAVLETKYFCFIVWSLTADLSLGGDISGT